MKSRSTSTLAITFGADGALPTEFRLFVAGWNETENGRFLFDEKAATETMAAYKQWGVDLAIDLEHQMLADGIAPDPTAKDARGWCKLELRPDGSLWAVDVKWTADGAARLSEKRQRYVSPAFAFDPESKRVLQIVNVAITSIPATHDTPALMAASVSGGSAMTIEEFLKVCKALGLDMTMSLDDAMAKIKGDPDASTEDAPPPAGDGGADENAEMNAAPPADEQKPEVAAASVKLMRLTGKTTFVDAVAEVETFRASHIELETERAKLAAERATLENAERRKLCVELVTLGAEFPATVWTDEKSTALKARWVNMPIAELRTHVEEQRKARPAAAKNSAKQPPAGPAASATPTFTVDGKIVTLTPEQLESCARNKCDPQVFARLIAPRTQNA